MDSMLPPAGQVMLLQNLGIFRGLSADGTERCLRDASIATTISLPPSIQSVNLDPGAETQCTTIKELVSHSLFPAILPYLFLPRNASTKEDHAGSSSPR